MLPRVVVLCACLGYTIAADWGYGEYGNGPDEWGKSFQYCNGQSQSPVDIKEGDVTDDTVNLPNFVFNNYDTDLALKVSNNGHSVVVTLPASTEVKISNGGLGDTYRAVQFHFHWGSSSAQGSEHLVNHKAYPMELHIVHYNTKYADLTAAIVEDDGLAVLGFMYEVQADDNQNYADIVATLSDIQVAKQVDDLTAASMESFLPPTYASSKFYRYKGSLTTPTCNEAVTWTVMQDSIKISESQLAKFRTVLDTHSKPIVDNYRPVMPLNSRQVTANFQPDLHWGYSTHVSPNHWKDYYGSCGGASQSPIDIPKFDAVPNDKMAPFAFTGYGTDGGFTWTMKNNGHAAQIDFSQGSMMVSGGGLPTTYRALQLHFHWGKSADMGSEHLVQGKAYPMELHIVHYNKDMQVNTAVKTPKGLAVLGFFFEESNTDNPNYASIVEKLTSIKEKSEISIPAFRLDSLIPDLEHLNHYYRYDGSLTTPGCYESVVWTVFGKTIPISRVQLDAFRKLISSEKLEDNTPVMMFNNFRPIQPLNTRQVTVAVPKWSYAGHHGATAAHWGDYYAYCKDDAGSRQSPINIDPTTVYLDVSLKEFEFKNWDQKYDMKLKNTGHSVNVNLLSETTGITTTGGGLGDMYQLAQFHFHWGNDSSKGSEHLLDNAAYPMEVHFVHFNTKYGNINNALKKEDGLAVLGFMFEIGDNDNPAMAAIVSQLSSIVNPGAEADISQLAANSILPTGLADYYRYLGSLTTPGCYESVTWTVFRETIVISEKQMAEFRKLKSHDKDANNNHMHMVDNYRPVQKRHNREIKATFLIGAGVTTTHSVMTLLVCVLAAMFHRSA